MSQHRDAENLHESTQRGIDSMSEERGHTWKGFVSVLLIFCLIIILIILIASATTLSFPDPIHATLEALFLLPLLLLVLRFLREQLLYRDSIAVQYALLCHFLQDIVWVTEIMST